MIIYIKNVFNVTIIFFINTIKSNNLIISAVLLKDKCYMLYAIYLKKGTAEIFRQKNKFNDSN